MNKQPLYSIGHGARKIGDFISLLHFFKIQYLADVRSYPQSRFHPQFNRKPLEESLNTTGIQYIFMGDQLGGRPKDRTCYVADRINYTIVQSKDFYRQGIDRLKAAHEKNLAVAIMCSERNPGDCHRSRLIGQTLAEHGITLLHIDEHGKLVEQAFLMNRLKNADQLF